MSVGDLSREPLSIYVAHLCAHVDKSFFEMAAEMRTNPYALWKELENENKTRVQTVERVANYFDVTVDSLISRAVDSHEALRRKRGDVIVPERYNIGAASKIRTVLPVMEHIRQFHGEKLYRNVMRQLGITKKTLTNPDMPVSIRLLKDTLALLEGRGLTEDDFFAMGYHVTRIPQNSRIAKSFSTITSHGKIYEHLVETSGLYYEKNFEYRLRKITANSVIMAVNPRPEVQEAFKSKVIDSRAVAVYRQGLVAAHPAYSEMTGCRIVERKCMHRGDEEFLFEVIWD